jgi:hypothetical protein
MPVPDSELLSPVAPTRVPVRDPAAVGVKVTVIVQVAGAEKKIGMRAIGQLLVWAKSPVVLAAGLRAVEPPHKVGSMGSWVEQKLLRVKKDGALVVPTVCSPKSWLAGERVPTASAVGAAIPSSATVSRAGRAFRMIQAFIEAT